MHQYSFQNKAAINIREPHGSVFLKWGLVLAIALFSSQTYCADSEFALTHDAKNLADWISESGDNQDLPFIIVDKKETKVFLFLSDGKLYSATPALMGVTIGDDTSPGIGQKKLSDIKPEERTTPAGRFEAQLGVSPTKSEMLWIDYESGVSMHPVVTSNPSEHRLQRLASSNSAERRITYGCVNVSSIFYKEHVHQTFKNSSGIVYVLPEIHSIEKVFGAEAKRFSERE